MHAYINFFIAPKLIPSLVLVGTMSKPYMPSKAKLLTPDIDGVMVFQRGHSRENCTKISLIYSFGGAHGLNKCNLYQVLHTDCSFGNN